ncbi:RNA polymerase sigma factor [Pontibacter litorisediminis]|uniref:RNA polymerase sigma factor n=1 Tax=Pontibacter litorisediminis TaxID=1846260 RepID=UPI0023EABA8C|nr:sigma-70 family RNA polymerase sigma factor [Pontibacter litorisediminis]
MLAKLYDAYAPVMMGLISRIVEDADVAEEVLKNSFVAIWTRIGRYDGAKERLLTWSLAIAREVALETLKDNTQNTQAKPNALQENKSVSLQHSPIKKEDLCRLAPLEKAVLEQLYLKGRTCAETAAELGIAEAEVRVVLKRAFTYLKAEKPV